MFPICFTKRDIENLHDKSLWVFENAGVAFDSESALELFAKHGAKVENGRVFIPEALLNQALDTTVKSFTIHGNGKSVTIGGGKPVLAGASGGIKILKDGSPRNPVTEDYIAAVKLDDTSRVLGFVNCQQIYTDDIPAAQTAQLKTALALKHTSKPIIAYCSNYEQSVSSLSFARNFFENQHEYYALGVGNMISPLQYSRESVGAIQAYAEYGQPMVLACCSGLGLTSPITVGGTIVQNNVEVLAGIVYGQLLRPGLPMVYGNVSSGSDMRYGSTASGSMESLAMIPLIRELSAFYGLPARAGGAFNDAKEVDYQAGAESSLGLLACLYNGMDFVMHAAGEYNGYNNYSMEKQVMDEEIIESYLYMRNVDMLSDEAIGVETIQNVIESGQYMMEEHTMERLRTAQYVNHVMSREFYSSWESSGKTGVLDKAQEIVRERLQSHTMPCLTKEQKKMLDEALA